MSNLKRIDGQYDTMPTVTPDTATYEVTLSYSDGNALLVKCDTNNSTTQLNFVLPTPNDWPSTGYYGAKTVIIVVGTVNPSVAVPSGWTAITLVVSKTNRIIIEKVGAGNGRHDGVVSY